MLTTSTTVASHPNATPVTTGHVPPDAPVLEVTAASGGGETQTLVPTSPAPVLITEQQVRFATAAAGSASQAAVIRRSWIVVLWQRLSAHSTAERQPRRYHPQARASYIERAAMAREMERL